MSQFRLSFLSLSLIFFSSNTYSLAQGRNAVLERFFSRPQLSLFYSFSLGPGALTGKWECQGKAAVMKREPSDLLFSLDLKCVCMLDEMLEAARYLEQNTTKRGNMYQYHHQTLIHEPAQGLCGRLFVQEITKRCWIVLTEANELFVC